MEKWKTAIREAQTFSRMHILLGMLDACIKWDMSAENARCKVCRRKGKSCHQPLQSCSLEELGVSIKCASQVVRRKPKLRWKQTVGLFLGFGSQNSSQPQVCKTFE